MQKKLATLFLLIYCAVCSAQTYPSLNVNLLSHIDPEKGLASPYNNKYSGCYGWFQSTKIRSMQ